MPITVDYFSHDWDMLDLAHTASELVRELQRTHRQRIDVQTSGTKSTRESYRLAAESCRLERLLNVAWRQMARPTNKVDPRTINWQKNSDVIWLYGPLYRDRDSTLLPKEGLKVKPLSSLPSDRKLRFTPVVVECVYSVDSPTNHRRYQKTRPHPVQPENDPIYSSGIKPRGALPRSASDPCLMSRRQIESEKSKVAQVPHTPDVSAEISTQPKASIPSICLNLLALSAEAAAWMGTATVYKGLRYGLRLR